MGACTHATQSGAYTYMKPRFRSRQLPPSVADCIVGGGGPRARSYDVLTDQGKRHNQGPFPQNGVKLFLLIPDLLGIVSNHCQDIHNAAASLEKHARADSFSSIRPAYGFPGTYCLKNTLGSSMHQVRNLTTSSIRLEVPSAPPELLHLKWSS